VSLNRLVEEWATVALAQLDAENHYRLTNATFDVARIQRAYIHAVSWAREVHLDR
jgi:hypothetical protein